MSQISKRHKAPLVNRYIDAIHNTTRPNMVENTIDNGRNRNHVASKRNDTPQDSTSPLNPSGRKRLGVRPSPEELKYSQAQRFQSGHATIPAGFTMGNPSIPVVTPICSRESIGSLIPSTFQVIPQTKSSESTDLDWEDDISSSSFTSNSQKNIKITNTEKVSSQGQSQGVYRKNNELSGDQQDLSDETEQNTSSENSPGCISPSISKSKSVKDRIKSFQSQTAKREPPSVAAINPVINLEQDQNDNEDKENGEKGTNNDTIQRSTATFGAISHGENVNASRSTSGVKALVSPATPTSSSKKSATTASFLVPISTYPSRQQLEKVETQSSQNEPKQTSQNTSPTDFTEDSSKICSSPNQQATSGECLALSESLPTPGSSSTLIAFWGQREADAANNNVPPLRKMPASKKVANPILPSVPVLLSRFVDCDTNSEAGCSVNSPLSATPLIKLSKRPSTASLKSLNDEQLDALASIVDQQVEAKISILEARMEKDFNDRLQKIETRLNFKIKEMMKVESSRDK